MPLSIKGKTALVIGCGESGLGATLLLKSLGAHVRITDSSCREEMLQEYLKLLPTQDVEIELGNHSKDFFQGVDFAILSPGIPPQAPILQWLQEAHIPIWGELDFASRFAPGKMIAITGSNGKSTTSTLLWKILKNQGFRASLAGNIGRSFSRAIVEDAEVEVWVLEVSSFQLEKVEMFHPWISLILNLSNNHLDRYVSMQEYAQAKKNIYKNQSQEDWLILNRSIDSLLKPNIPALFVNAKQQEKIGIFVEKGWIRTRFPGQDIKDILPVEEVPLPGAHYLENVMFASAASLLAGASVACIRETIKNFAGLEHRQEKFGNWDGIQWVNDSKSTSVDAVRSALEAFPKPIVWIAGGRLKSGDFSSLKNLVKEKVREGHFYGEAASKLEACFKEVCPSFTHHLLKDVIALVRERGKAQDTILLSPGCASFDQFKNFEERGSLFKKWIQESYRLAAV